MEAVADAEPGEALARVPLVRVGENVARQLERKEALAQLRVGVRQQRVVVQAVVHRRVPCVIVDTVAFRLHVRGYEDPSSMGKSRVFITAGKL